MDEVPVMYAVLHPPNFFAQAAALEHPELRKRAFAVFDGQAPREFVFAMNKAARRLGVEDGAVLASVEVGAIGVRVDGRRVCSIM